MLGKIIGAMAGAKAAEHSRKVDGAGGALLGALAVPVVTRIARRMGPLGWIAAAAGGYAYKRYTEKSAAQPKVRPSAT
jgi:hypothetical protein